MSANNNDIPPEELLEEMLREGEQEFFPKFRRQFLRFIDTFNHATVQHEVISIFDNLNLKLDAIDSSKNVFIILRSLKSLLEFVKDQVNPSKLLSKLQQSGYFALVNDNRFNFLDEHISLDESAERLLNLVKIEGTTNVNQAFEEYVKSWSANQRGIGRTESYIEREVRLMRNGRTQADSISNKEVQEIINDVRKYFEPLRKKLMPLQTINKFTFGLFNLAGNKTEDFIGANAFTKNTNRSHPGWFDNVVRVCTDFLEGKKSESSLRDFLEGENLEDDFHLFKECMNNWLQNIRLKARHPSGFHISNQVAVAELDRMAKFIYAVALNKPELLNEHTALVESLIKKAADGTEAGLIPFVSFGQLPLPRLRGTRKISLTFVLPSDKSRNFAENVLRELRNVFTNIEREIVEEKNSLYILRIDVNFDENLAVLIARNVARLSDLSIRAVLVGSFGLGGFRHATYPEFNRIYGIETAEGFTSISFSGALMRGDEPYYCPTGWRRFAINVGMTGSEFEEAYGDWPLAYHGTAGHISASILQSGLRASGEGCYLDSDLTGCVYLSPSIEYCGHPRYSNIWKVRNMYVQMVLVVRVKKCLVYDKKPGTLPGAFPHEPTMDQNFPDNKSLEWLIKWPPGSHVDAVGGLVVYGLMLRVTSEHPGKLPQCSWWEKSKDDCWNYF